MLYSILCYESEALAAGRTKQEDDAMMVRLGGVLQQLKSEGKLGPVARLMPTTTATHIRSGKEPTGGVPVIDGPFAETKEQLLGFYVVDCPTLEDAITAAKLLGREKPHGTLEIRPVAVFNPLGVSPAGGISVGGIPTANGAVSGSTGTSAGTSGDAPTGAAK